MEFRLREKLGSYEITVDLIQRIERFIFEELPDLLKLKASEIKKNYKLEITEKIGTEKIKSITNYRDPEFPDDTREILISTETDTKNFRFKSSLLMMMMRNQKFLSFLKEIMQEKLQLQFLTQ